MNSELLLILKIQLQIYRIVNKYTMYNFRKNMEYFTGILHAIGI